jgi:sugar fermentation stimulation protein A
MRFGPTIKARFIERPNRFLVRCRTRNRGEVEAYLANSGRLWELLRPDAKLYITERPPSSELRTRYKVLAVEREGEPVFLDTHLTNTVTRFLLDRRRIPPLAGAEVIRQEVPVGTSRIDFLLKRGRRQTLLEVKSCTLFGNEIAMFPDAVTERGRRHLEELAIRRRDADSAILFLVHASRVRWFMPDYHTDLCFSQSFLKLRKKVQIYAAAIEWRHDLSLGPRVRMLEIPWEFLQREVRDRGSYLLVIRLDEGKRIRVGRLGTFPFRRGYHVYVGSAMNSLSARIARHRRLRKKLHWHIDYLRQEADSVVALPIRSSKRHECDVATSLSKVLKKGPAGFGASDCGCATHLFFSARDPLEQIAFHEVLQRFRMRRPR